MAGRAIEGKTGIDKKRYEHGTVQKVMGEGRMGPKSPNILKENRARTLRDPFLTPCFKTAHGMKRIRR